MQHNELLALLVALIQDFAPPGKNLRANSVDETTILCGDDGILDSLGLVSYLIEVEHSIRECSGVDSVLVDERAVSAEQLPFRSIGSLADYARQLLAESRHE
jgi:hypothetical protein